MRAGGLLNDQGLAVKLLFVLIAVVLAANGFDRASADANLSPQEILATAKIAGACGILDQQVQFQKTTQMPGGDGFVFRFWSTEAMRLGKSIEEYSDTCNKAISAYDKLWKASE